MSGKGYFITGTDTGVGKTLICCALLHGFAALGKSVIGMKPVAAGAVRGARGLINDDVALLRAASNVEAPLALVNPYCFEPPIAPHLAAEQAGVVLDPALRAQGLTLAGWIANRIDPAMAAAERNVAALAERLSAPLLGDIGFTADPE